MAIGAAPTQEGFLRLSVIRALLEGHSRDLVCDMFHVSDRRVRLWVHRFNEYKGTDPMHKSACGRSRIR